MASHFKLMILICLEISLFLPSSMAIEISDGLSQSTKRFCGRMLTDSLALICDGQYRSILPMDEQSDESFGEYQYNDQPAASNLPDQYQSYSRLAKIAPDTIRSRIRRDWINRRGVYDECCRKPCSFQELRSYCKRKN